MYYKVDATALGSHSPWHKAMRAFQRLLLILRRTGKNYLQEREQSDPIFIGGQWAYRAHRARRGAARRLGHSLRGIAGFAGLALQQNHNGERQFFLIDNSSRKIKHK